MVKRRVRKSAPFGIKVHAYLYWFLGLAAVFVGVMFVINKHQNPPCANSISCINDLTGNIDIAQKEGEFMGQIIQIPQEVAQETESKAVLGDSSNKHIYIDLTNQKLIAKEGDRTIYEFLVSTGKWGRTPTGEFTTWIKLRYTRMTGGNKAIGTYYNLPNVPYVMYFANAAVPKWRGYGIHGAYWHNNFGHPMSHGCINVKPEEAGLLYAWANPQSGENSITVDGANPGTPITIYGTAPQQ